MRVLLFISYDGTRYSGWQWQENALSVQQVLEEALEKATGESVRLVGASRTDAGVHALCQAAHFDTRCSIPAEKFPYALNQHLPEDIRVFLAREVPETFHARYHTQGKTYTYRIHHSPHASAIHFRTRLHVPGKLDSDLMHQAAQVLIGTHDFAAFSAAGGSAKTTVREIYDINVTRDGELVSLIVNGNAFLYNMVRIIVGSLIEIGQGKRTESCFAQAFDTKERLSLGVTAPAHGLELTRIWYAF